MVRPEGIEPSTYGLEVRCSIQLSYRRIREVLYKKSLALAIEEFAPKIEKYITMQNSNSWDYTKALIKKDNALSVKI